MTDPEKYPPESEPVSVFMAGSPGARKTEASIELLEGLDGDAPSVLRIDPDELRELFPGYVGGNARLSQEAVSRLVEKLVDYAFKQRQSFLPDGTLSGYGVAEKNVKRLVHKDRSVKIIYVYQDPASAWDFVIACEAEEGHRIHIETFVQQYFATRDVVNPIKHRFGKQVIVDLLLTDTDHISKVFFANGTTWAAVYPRNLILSPSSGCSASFRQDDYPRHTVKDFLVKRKTKGFSSPLSDFVRHASSAEKRAYKGVMERATERELRVI